MSLPETYKVLFSSGKPGLKPQVREVPLQKPGKNQVLIKVEYAPINPTDLLASENFYTPDSGIQYPVGSEGSGIIVAVGEELQVPFKVGERVHFLGQSWGQYALQDSNQVFAVQEGLSLEDAASHFVNPATVYYMGQLVQQNGSKAVIHSAGSSALGRLLIRYFKHLGIKLINIVRREDAVEELKKEGVDYVLNSQEPGFEARLKEIAHKENATFALDALCGDFTNIIVKAMPSGSVVWLYGVLSSPIIKVEMLELANRKRIEALNFNNNVMEMIQQGKFREFMEVPHKLLPTIFKSKVQKVFKFEELDQALEFYGKNSSKGKVLLKLN